MLGESVKQECFAWSSAKLSQDPYPAVPLPVTPPWLFPSVSVDFYILEKCRFIKILVTSRSWWKIDYKCYIKSLSIVYTDGSKDPDTGSTRFPFSIPALKINVKEEHQIICPYTVETMAIATALQWTEELQLEKNILSSDSCSALMSLQSFMSHTRQDIVNEMYDTLYRLKSLIILVIFMWIPACKHKGQ